MGLYQIGQRICRMYLSSKYKVEVIGAENLPADGGVLLCCNHISNLDPPLLGAYISRPIRYMAKQELFEKPILKSLLPKLGAFPVRRGMSDKQALRKGMDFLKQGEMLGLFPEGTRSKDGKLGKGLAGAGFFALRTNAAVVPCAIVGPYKKGQPLKLIYGKPMDFEQIRLEKRSADDATAIIMDEIGQLIELHSKEVKSTLT
ncbi:1-acyl-sn-glycerol-3-phosphate acyltransferase [Alkalihalophilus pseudofirmus OF4]|uniref:1-acyl-sn-glycerol-3-phosphate acyltransferase n=3 Tax=Alkalihalophilus TaxID=2893060 RepID=D3G030_ALKPO|nr:MULTISPECIES: lysophospholipid acyltransferase family protein [Alkalihalophilus]ADC51115.1 1-acyl-sn-glycerol-3-phosphate acyltransferase [Alkalihalophilus pseudofirmus OF4]MDV2884308.1 lysophospholipid acyltransferase family protein [Alkalihalophilus pseudofirmus]MED1601486.1 lysophospholipid acyltransferase family protein [Alkalihalophilus marmarensis]WEG18328.1 lysophospholipid acyltransferase family protein [Alkalihalophilus pseudofirmus]